MEKEISSASGNLIDIRYNKFYSAVNIILSIILIIILLIAKGKDKVDYVFLVLAFAYFAHSIYTLTGAKYVRLDKQNKKVIIYTLFGLPAEKYKYDRLFFNNKELFRVINGKKKFINIFRPQCNKNDYEAFINEIDKGV